MVSDGAPLRGVTIRQATVADIPDLIQLRRVMFESMDLGDQTELEAMEKASTAYLVEAIADGRFYGCLATTPIGEAVGAGGVIIDQHLPTPANLSGKIGYILNIVTVPSYRRRGIARRVLQMMLAWLTEQGVRWAQLHASNYGRSLYESLGFEPTTNEMRLRLEEASGG